MKKSRNSIFFKIFISYFSFAFSAIVIIFVVYTLMSASILKTSQKQTMSMISQVQTTVDNNLVAMKSVSYYLQHNTSLSGILKDEKYSSLNYELFKISNSLPKYNLLNKYIQQVDIVCKNSTYVISPQYAVKYYLYYLENNESYNEEEYKKSWDLLWKNKYSSQLFVKQSENGASTKYYYLDSISYSDSASPIGLVLITLKDNFIHDLLESLDFSKESAIMVVDSNDKLIDAYIGQESNMKLEEALSYIERVNTDNQLSKYNISFIHSHYNKWRYIAVAPKDIVLAEYVYFKRIMFILSIVSVIFSLGISYLLTRNKAAILTRVCVSLGSMEDKSQLKNRNGNSYLYIEGAVNSLIHNHQNLLEIDESRKPLLQAAYTRKLLFGECADEEEVYSTVNDLSPELGAKKNIVILVKSTLHKSETSFDDEPVFDNSAALLMKEMIFETFKNPIYLLDIDKYRFAVIMFFDIDMDDNIIINYTDSQLIKIQNQLLEEVKLLNATCFISDIFYSPEMIATAFSQVKEIEQKALNKYEKIIVRESDLPPELGMYYYPFETEIKLMQMLKKGKKEDIHELLKDIYIENFEKRNLSIHITDMLMNALKGTIFRVLKEFNISPDVTKLMNELEKSTSVLSVYNLVVRIIFQECDEIYDQQVHKHALLKKNIAQAIEQHYMEQDFSIHNICVKFYMSESSLYQFFRENMDESFAEMLEKTRISKACVLLSDRRIAIKDIAVKTGYATDISFRRAFKRVMKLSPSEYRESVLSER